MKPLMFSDEHYLRCIRLAACSKGKERYGSIMIAEGRIIGEGYNQAIAHPAFGRLEREIRQGMANHAEIEAMNNALANGFCIEGSILYVAGYFPKTGLLFFKQDYTCVRCLPHLRNYGIESICIPSPEGWLAKTLEAAGDEAKKYTKGTHRKRLEAAVGEFFISELDLPEYPR
jgi:deoxycytidylate deaminase